MCKYSLRHFMQVFVVIFLLFSTGISGGVFAANDSATKAFSLQHHIRQAVQKNAQIQSVHLLHQSTLAHSEAQSVLPQPTVSGAYALQPVQTRLGPQVAKFAVQQKIPWPGVLQQKQKSIRLQGQEYEWMKTQIQNDVALQVATLWYKAIAVQYQTKLFQRDSVLLQQLYDQAAMQWQHGITKQSSVLRLQNAMRTNAVELQNLFAQYETLQNQWQRVMNQKDSLQIHFEYDPTLQNALHLFDHNEHDSLWNDSQYNAPQAPVQQAPMLQATRAKESFWQQQQQLIHKQSMPQFTVGLEYGLINKPPTSATQMNDPQNGQDAVMIMLGIALPVYRKGFSAANKQAQLRQQSLQKDYQQLEWNLKTQWQNQILEWQNQQRLITLYQSNLKNQMALEATLVQEYQTGQSELSQLLSAYKEGNAMRVSYINALAQAILTVHQIKHTQGVSGVIYE
jgi:outer membrane protein, heavy metal efflux system